MLSRFESLFTDGPYLHRSSALGDAVAVELFEDLLALDAGSKFSERVNRKIRVINRRNTRRGIPARRGDGTFGEIIPNTPPLSEDLYRVARGEIATVEIGAEVKILAKAMIKQIDRVIGDLTKQTEQFKLGGGAPISVGIVGINRSSFYTSYEGERSYPTDGKKYLHPIQEAAAAEQRLVSAVRPHFSELLILRFRATNVPPYPFEWVDKDATERDYGAAITRILRTYEQRF